MEYMNHHPKVFVLSGKAQSGKNLVADMIEKYYEDKKCMQLSYAYYLKLYAQKISDWDGLEATKPRALLQSLGIDLIKEQIDNSLLIRRVCEDVKVYSYFYDIIMITDARLIDEIIVPQKLFSAITIRIEREAYDNNLQKEEKNHITETQLDTYQQFDYIIINHGDIEDLKAQLYTILEEVEI